jgi:hypothetical protein
MSSTSWSLAAAAVVATEVLALVAVALADTARLWSVNRLVAVLLPKQNFL